MYNSKLLMLLSIFCLLSSFTVRAQTSDFLASSDSNNNGNMDASENMNENTEQAETSMAAMSDSNTEQSEATMAAMSDSNTEQSEATMPATSDAAPQNPTSLLTTYAVDIHFLAVNTTVQYIAYHYCSALSAGQLQCAVYNGTANNSRLVATELIVSADIFATLSDEEKMLWHSHAFAIRNGLFVIPGLPADQEETVYEGIAATYGKVVDFWHSFQDFPSGTPQLAYGLTADNQIDESVADQLDMALNVGTTWRERQQTRANWTIPEVVAGADAWLTSGMYPQYVTQVFNVTSAM